MGQVVVQITCHPWTIPCLRRVLCRATYDFCKSRCSTACPCTCIPENCLQCRWIISVPRPVACHRVGTHKPGSRQSVGRDVPGGFIEHGQPSASVGHRAQPARIYATIYWQKMRKLRPGKPWDWSFIPPSYAGCPPYSLQSVGCPNADFSVRMSFSFHPEPFCT